MRGESGACLQNDAKALVTSVHTGNTPSHTRTQDNGTDRHLGRVEHELTRMLAKRRILAAGLFCHMAGFREGFLGALQPKTQALRRSVANKACCSLWRATAHSASNSFQAHSASNSLQGVQCVRVGAEAGTRACTPASNKDSAGTKREGGDLYVPFGHADLRKIVVEDRLAVMYFGEHLRHRDTLNPRAIPPTP